MRAIGVLVLLSACAPAGPAGPVGVLVYSRTTGYRHASIADGVAALRALDGAELRVEASEDPAVFADLARFGVVVFLSTTGDALDAAGEAALEAWVGPGRGWVGVHSAADTEYTWPFYGDLVGAWFKSHPAIQPATMIVEDGAHPATATLPATWLRSDEWYDFRENPRGRAHVLLRIDEASYQGGQMGADHPLAWCRALRGGRAIYTALGHTAESWREPAFLAHVTGAVRWAAGLAAGECPP